MAYQRLNVLCAQGDLDVSGIERSCIFVPIRQSFDDDTESVS